MSRRAKSDSGETRRGLLKAAAAEFAARGYEGASLRQICSKAGVTTGALYFFFENKEDLFRQVIAPVTDQVLGVFSGHYERFINVPSSSDPIDGLAFDEMTSELILDLFFGNKTIINIITNNRKNSVVEEFFNQLVGIISDGVRTTLEESGKILGQSDDFIITWLATTEINTVIDILENDEKRCDADRHMLSVVCFIRSGVEGIATA